MGGNKSQSDFIHCSAKLLFCFTVCVEMQARCHLGGWSRRSPCSSQQAARQGRVPASSKGTGILSMRGSPPGRGPSPFEPQGESVLTLRRPLGPSLPFISPPECVKSSGGSLRVRSRCVEGTLRETVIKSCNYFKIVASCLLAVILIFLTAECRTRAGHFHKTTVWGIICQQRASLWVGAEQKLRETVPGNVQVASGQPAGQAPSR